MYLAHLTRNIDILKKSFCEVSNAYCKSGLYTLKFHLLDDLAEDVDRLGIFQLLDSSAFEQNNVHIRSAHRSTSKCHLSSMEETVREMERWSTSENGCGGAMYWTGRLQ